MKRSISFILTLALLLMTVAGCSGGGDTGEAGSAGGAEGSPGYKDTITVASDLDPALDPWLALIASDMIVCRQVYDTLFYLGDKGALIPGLAESMEWVDDTHIKLNLRQGVKFHDGTEFTAEDVVYWYDTLPSYARSASRNQAFDSTGHQVVDKYTAIIQLKFPFADAPQQMTRHCIGSKKAIEEMGIEEYNAKPIGTGPYKIDEYISGTEVTMTRFDDYWQGPAETEHIKVRVIPDESSRVIELETGGVDMILAPSTSNFKRIESTEGLKLTYEQAYQFSILMYSYQDPVLSENKDLRMALTAAVDVDAIINSVYDGYWYPMDTLWSPLIAGATPHERPEYNLEKAKELMAKAGYPNGGLKFRMHTINPAEKKVAEAIQNMWKPLGVELEIFQMPQATFEATYTHQVAVGLGTAPFMGNTISRYKWDGKTQLMPPGEGKMGELEHLAEGEIDDAKRQQYLDELQELIWDEGRVLPIACGVMAYGMTDKIEGFEFDLYGAPYLRTVKVRA